MTIRMCCKLLNILLRACFVKSPLPSPKIGLLLTLDVSDKFTIIRLVGTHGLAQMSVHLTLQEQHLSEVMNVVSGEKIVLEIKNIRALTRSGQEPT